MNNIFLILTLLVLGLNHCSANEIQPKKYKLDATIIFSNGDKLETTTNSIYPTFEEMHCTDETIIVSLIVGTQGNITKPEKLISGPDYFIEEIQETIGKLIVPKKYYGLKGVMSIHFNILKKTISKTIYASAVEMFESGNFSGSFAKLSEIKSDDKNNICVLMSMGDALTKQEKYLQAIPYYDQALKISPKNDRIYYSRGYRRFKSGLLNKAIEDIQMSIKLRDVWENYYLLNKIYNQKEDYLKAIKYATLGFKFKEGAYFHNRRGLSYIANGNYKLALLDFEKIIELNPKSETGYFGKSKSLYYLKRYDKALIVINKSIDLNISSVDILFTKALIFDKQMKVDKAIDVYKEIIKRFNAGSGTYNNLGWAYLKLGKYNYAIDVYNYALQNGFENSYFILNNLALTYFLNRQYDLSIKFYNMKINLDKSSDNTPTHAGKARSLIKQNKLGLALKELKYVIKTNTEYKDSYYNFKYGKGNYLKIIINEFKELASKTDDRKMLIEINKLISQVNNNE